MPYALVPHDADWKAPQILYFQMLALEKSLLGNRAE
jgi:hypothetical protein